MKRLFPAKSILSTCSVVVFFSLFFLSCGPTETDDARQRHKSIQVWRIYRLFRTHL